MNIKGKLGALMAMSLMFDGMAMPGHPASKGRYSADSFSADKPKKPIPIGCKEYFFNKNGGYNFSIKNDSVFSCVALSLSSAKKKFYKWEKQNNG